jgi:hypothetical protein
MPETKICTKCGVEKSIEEFGKDRRGKYGRKARCNTCLAEYARHLLRNNRELADRQRESHRRWRRDNPERVKAYMSAWHASHKEHEAADRKKRFTYAYRRKVRLKHDYGLAPENVVAMYVAQEFKCAICGKEVPYSKLEIDHNHKTGKVRQLLCKRCNTMVGYAEMDPEKMRPYREYLERHSE